ncbi:MAG: GDSL-type esterase/lipase family protein [Oscillospiraceae bacterium]|nr:GDSL-type esterase/lipase family protein [Oscillospiraceae bacterium]
MRKSVCCILALCCLAGCGTVGQSQETSQTEESVPAVTEKNLVTLGDSISFGYGLEDPGQERYSVLLRSMLEQRDNLAWKDYNYALSGDDSSDLLMRLQNGRAVRLPSADTIILYIGANNILGVYEDYAMEIADAHDIHPSEMTDEQLEELAQEIQEEMQDKEKLLEEVETRVEENLVRMESDMEAIYNWIRQRNSTADIYVLNVYNPYTELIEANLPVEDQEFYEYAQEKIDCVNEILRNLTTEHTDLVYVDIASVFAACDTPPILGSVSSEESEQMMAEYLDPHPNAEGQRMIAETLYQYMSEKKNDE